MLKRFFLNLPSNARRHSSYNIELIAEEKVILATINSNVANYLNYQSLQDWNNLLDEIENVSNKSLYSKKPIIFTSPNESKYFGSGMDLKSTATVIDMESNKELFGKFEETVKRLMTLQHRTIAKIHGFAIAGGFIFGLSCDVRCGLVSNQILMGINGIEVGLCYPSITYLLLLQRMPHFTSKLLIAQTNKLFDTETAFNYGYLTDFAKDKDELMKLCVTEALRIDEDSMNAYLTVKNYLFQNQIEIKWENEREEVMREFLRVRKSKQTQRRLQHMVDKLNKKKNV